MKKLSASLFLLVIAISSFSQTPNWTKFNYRQLNYPNSEYYVGFSENNYNKKTNPQDVLMQLKEKAASNISSSIRVNVESLTTSFTQETEKDFSSQFKKIIASYSNIELVGIQYQTYIDEKEYKAYVLAYIDKKQLNKYYLQQLTTDISKLEIQVNKAKSFFKAANIQQTKVEYENSLILLNGCNSMQSVLFAIGITPRTELHTEKLSELNKQLDDLLVKIESGENRSIKDLAVLMSDNIASQLPVNTQLKLGYPTYADTKFTSPFAKQFVETMKQQLLARGMGVVEVADNSTLLLKGTYWEENTLLRVSLTVNGISGKTHAATESLIGKSYLQNNNISFKAENFTDAYSRMQEFRKDEIVSGDMLAEIWTSKGADNLLFQEGEIMKLFVRVNTICYLRVIYYLADGSKVLLLDNYYIDQTKINKVVEIPDEFECAEPFGFETMQLSAQSKPFNALKTLTQYGYQFINESTDAIMVNTRGFKKVTDEDKKSEVRLNITTHK